MPAEVKLLRSQANDVFSLIRRVEMEPAEFVWELVVSQFGRYWVQQLVHKPTGYYFVFDFAENKHCLRCSPWTDGPEHSSYTVSWNSQYDGVTEWLQALRREASAPDLWGQLSKVKPLTAENAPKKNTPFTRKEQTAITIRLDEISKSIEQSYSLTKAEFKLVHGRLEEMKESSERLGRKDWQMFVAGVIFNIAYDLAKTSSQSTAVATYLSQMLGQMIHQLPKLLKLPLT